ncbi:MAG: DUF1285 domain-containing protein [Filomicrobium sp.]
MVMQDKPGEVAGRLSGLEALLKSHAEQGLPPIEKWSPPYCGDIGLSISSDGQWSYRGSPIGRQRLVKLFSRVLWREPDGRHYLITPAEKVDVAVSDAAFLAVEMEVVGSGKDRRLIFRTNVDDVVEVNADNPLRFAEESETGGLKPYVLVRGRLEALVVRSLTYDLLEFAEVSDDGRTGIFAGGVFFEIESGVA